MAAMRVAAQAQTQSQLQLEGFGSKSMELKWVRRRITKTSHLEKKTKLSTKPLFPVFISTDPRHVDPHRLRDLFSDCNYSTHRLRPEPVDIHKLRIALSHSAVLVSVFCNVNAVVSNRDSSSSLIADFFTPVSPSRDQLVGFGRAVSDCGLTAAIYDVMVIPSLQRMGIGQMIVKKIVSRGHPENLEVVAEIVDRFLNLGILTNRDIYDIAALCSENERLFFKTCGFGNDILCSTTMMYTRTAPLTTQKGG